MRRLITLAALLAAPAFMPAFAGLKEDAKAQCVVISTAGIALPEGTPPDQVAQVSQSIETWCGCFTDKVSTLGPDGDIVLTVLANTTPEEAMAGANDPAKDKEITIGIAKREAGLSDADAEAWYARIDPQVKAMTQSCAAAVK